MMSESAVHPLHLKKNAIGGVIGNIMEWYDFAVFGYFAPIIGAQFFPSQDKLASIISAFGVFAAGYMMRPLGGVIFGSIGDRMGRKKALQISVAMMALPTALMGFLPTHAQIGVMASVLLVLLRLLQGVSVGGELIGSISFVTEIAPPHRRGLYGSFTLFSAICGVMLGSLVATIINVLLNDQQIHTWGWRIAFIVGFAVAGFSIWMRKSMVETPDFEKHQRQGDIEKNPVMEVIRAMPGAIIHILMVVIVMGGGFYILFVWWPTYLTKIIPHPVPHALTVNTISMLGLMIFIPCMGLLSDIWGRRNVLVLSIGALALLTYPLFTYTDHGAFSNALVCQLLFALCISGMQGAMPATMVEMFPTQMRFSGIALGYNTSLALFGGTAPLIATWLIDKTNHNIMAPAYYLIAMAVLSLTAAVFVHGKGGDELK
jgi:MHS family proline/betaine transporter-like MFS transporter